MRVPHTDSMRRTPFAVLTAFLLTLFVAVVPAVPAHAQGDERITA
ncbi:MutG family lantibiotic protection ABC superfamily ATP binding cassette transporter permease, partial [human gut metagenome]